MLKIPAALEYKTIPTELTKEQFTAFVLPHLSKGRRGPKTKLSFYHIFEYLLKVIYTGMQWKSLSIKQDAQGKSEIHYTRLYRVFCRWSQDGSLEKVFVSSVKDLANNHLLDTTILHGDGTSTAAKKGGDGIGYSGHKHYKGEMILAWRSTIAMPISFHPSR